MRPTKFVCFKVFKIYKQPKLNSSIAQEINIYWKLWDHCTAIFYPNELKFMRFWKSFESSFTWDLPNLYALKYSKFNSQSWMVLSPKKSIFTVLWEITVLPFLNEMSWNPWDSERVLKDLSDEINHILFSPQHKKVTSNWSWMVHTPKLPTTVNTLIWSFFAHFPKWIQFFCWNALVNTYSCQKNQLFWFLSFFTTTSIRRWILANLAPLPPPHGWPLPPIHSTTYLSVFWLH